MKVETKQNNEFSSRCLTDFQCYCHQHSVVSNRIRNICCSLHFFLIFSCHSAICIHLTIFIIICSTWQNLKCKFLKYTAQITQNTKDCDFSALQFVSHTQKELIKIKLFWEWFFYITFVYLTSIHLSIMLGMAASCIKQLPFSSNQQKKSINKNLHAFHILYRSNDVKAAKAVAKPTNGAEQIEQMGEHWTLYKSKKILLYYGWKINNHCT